MKFLKNLFDRRPKITAMIEMPMGTLKKIEIKDGIPIVDRELTIPVPINYGYIPGTLAEDGDALDIFVISNRILNTGELTTVRVIGMFECQDQGVSDNKVLAVVNGEDCNNLTNMCKVANYLMNYKPGFKLLNWQSGITLDELRKYKS